MVTPKKPKWGTAESHRRLDRRLTAIDERFWKTGLDLAGSRGSMGEEYERMRQADDEAGLCRLAEQGERAVALFESAHRAGGVELVRHLADEIHAERLRPEEEAVRAAIAAFQQKKTEAIRSEVSAEKAGDEAARRARETSDARSRIFRLPKHLRPSLLQQLEAIPVDGKPRDYRKAMYSFRRALRAAEGGR